MSAGRNRTSRSAYLTILGEREGQLRDGLRKSCRRGGGVWLRMAVCAISAWLFGGLAWGQSGGTGAGAASVAPGTDTPQTMEQALGELLGAESSASQRKSGAMWLASQKSEAGWEALLRALGGEAPEGAALAAIGALSDAGPPVVAVGPLVRACEDGRAEVAHAAAVALGNVSGAPREAIGAVVRVMGRSATAAQRAALWGALVRLTGREDVPADAGAWDAWWREHGFLPEGEWRVRLASAQAARAHRLARERDALALRLADVYGRVYALTRAEDRSSMLVGLIKDESAQVRLIGFDLASRALLNAQPLDASVADAAVSSLSGGTSELRAAAARLLANLAPKEVGPAIAALRAETDERVAAPLLRLLANRPDAGEIELCLRWLATSGPARPAAAEALAAIHRTAPLDGATATRAMELLSKIDPARISASSARLLGTLSGPTDVASVRAVWQAGEPGSRMAMAEGLASSDAGLGVLLEVVERPDAPVFDLACRVLATRAASVETFARMRAAGAHLGEAGLDGLARVLLALPEGPFERALASVLDGAARRELLARAGAHSAAGAGELAARIALARALDALGSKDGASALQHLDGVGAGPTRQDAALRRARVMALLVLGRLDEAEGAGGTASAWLDGLELCGGLAHEGEIRDRIARLFETTLTASERERLYGGRAPDPAAGATDGVGSAGASPRNP